MAPKVAITVLFDVVRIELHFGDEYLAQVAHEDIVDRIRAGEGIHISIDNPRERPRPVGN